MQFLPISLCINTRRYINTHFATFCKSFDSHLLIGAGRSAFARWQHGEKIVSEAAGVIVKQEIYAGGVLCRDDKTHVMPLLHTPANLPGLVCRRIGGLLASQRDHYTGLAL